MKKIEILRQVTFGAQIAEDEASVLDTYFVKTDQWRRISAGEVDVIYGAKGAGKSAIYSVLSQSTEQLFERNVLTVTAENPRGAPVFSDLVTEPPVVEREFVSLWKLYFASLLGSVFREHDIKNAEGKEFLTTLENAGLLPTANTLKAFLRAALDYVKQLTRLESVQAGVEIDPHSGLYKGVTGKISLREPSDRDKQAGFVSVDNLFALANSALKIEKFQCWILLDRLDVAFAETPELETNALRSLFRAYLDLVVFENISLKIFIRSDIWKRITQTGFREASHIRKDATIEWQPQGIMNLIVRRLIKNDIIKSEFQVKEDEILSSYEKQAELFYKIFPTKVEFGDKRPTTFDWILGRTTDGFGLPAPREIIHLLSAARDHQIKKLELGESEPPGDSLFVGQAFKDALPEVSKKRFDSTLLAEHSELRSSLLALEGKRTLQTVETLAEIWSISSDEAKSRAAQLTEAGFFKKEIKDGKITYWVPFLYRACLDMIQGTEE